MKENHITMILKKENRKNIENWLFGGFSKFKISPTVRATEKKNQ